MQVARIEDKMIESLLELFGHAMHRLLDAPTCPCATMKSECVKGGQDRPKITWMETYIEVPIISRNP